MLDLSVVIPAYNEEENLPPLWAELRGVLEGLALRFEVVFVDDGSEDRSAEIIRGLRDADARVRLVRLKANAGETAATDAGFKAARARLPRGRGPGAQPPAPLRPVEVRRPESRVRRLRRSARRPLDEIPYAPLRDRGRPRRESPPHAEPVKTTRRAIPVGGVGEE